MNLEEKVDAILTAVQTPVVAPVATVDLSAVTTALTAIAAQLTDIQGQVDEPPVTVEAAATASGTASA